MKIVHLSDLHVSARGDQEYEALRKVVLHVITHHPDAVVCITGDFVNNAGSDEFDIITGLLGPLETHCRHVVVCPGNHDVKWLGSFGAVDDGAFLRFRANLTQAHTRFPNVMHFDGVQLGAMSTALQAAGDGHQACDSRATIRVTSGLEPSEIDGLWRMQAMQRRKHQWRQRQ